MKISKRNLVRLRRFFGPLLTGLVFLAPVILTIVLLQFVFGYFIAALGPDSLVGGALYSIGLFLSGSPVFAFLFGIGAALALVWGLGLVIQTQARERIEAAFDDILGRLPVVGAIYRPMAQVVRMIGSTQSGEMKGMAVVSVRFGDSTEILGLLTTPEIFDTGDGPRHLIMLPTAPVPVGGALVFIATDKVRMVPELGVDDLAKFYVSMGAITPKKMLKWTVEDGVMPENAAKST